MSRAEVVVTLAGLAAIAWVNWYFFIAGRDRPARSTKRDARGEKAERQEGRRP
jgi:hypothetical protein